MHLAEKGKDPRKYTLIAFGGAGPVHAHNLARLLKMGKVVVPLGAGVASALGFLVAPPATDMVTSYVTRLERADWRHINALFADMVIAGCELLTEAGADPARIAYRPSAEMRHVGQGFEIPVPLAQLTLSAGDMPGIRAAFFDTYRLRFGRIMEESPIEVLSWRLGCVAPGLEIRLGGAGPADGAAGSRTARIAQGAVRIARLAGLRGLRPLQAAGGRAIRRPGTDRGTRIHLRRRPRRVVSVDAIRNLVVELG